MQEMAMQRGGILGKALCVFMSLVLVLGLNPGLNKQRAWADGETVDVMDGSVTVTKSIVSGSGSFKLVEYQYGQSVENSTVLVSENDASGSVSSSVNYISIVPVSGTISNVTVTRASSANVNVMTDAYKQSGSFGYFLLPNENVTVSVTFEGGANPDPQSDLALTLQPTKAAGNYDLLTGTGCTLGVGISATNKTSAATYDDVTAPNSMTMEWFLNDSAIAEKTDTDFAREANPDYGWSASTKFGQEQHTYQVSSEGLNVGDTLKVTCKVTWVVGEETATKSLDWTFTVVESMDVTVTTTPADNVSVTVVDKASGATIGGYDGVYTLNKAKTYTITASPTGDAYDHYKSTSVEWTSATGNAVNLVLPEKGEVASLLMTVYAGEELLTPDECTVTVTDSDGKACSRNYANYDDTVAYRLEKGLTYTVAVTGVTGYEDYSDTFTFDDALVASGTLAINLEAKTVTLTVKAKDSWTGQSLTNDICNENITVTLREGSKAGQEVYADYYEMNVFEDVKQGQTYYIKFHDARDGDENIYGDFETTFTVGTTTEDSLEQVILVDPLVRQAEYTIEATNTDVDFEDEYWDWSLKVYEGDAVDTQKQVYSNSGYSPCLLTVGETYHVCARATNSNEDGTAKYQTYEETFVANATSPKATKTITLALRQYDVTFKDGDTVLSTAKYDYGTPAADIAVPADPTKEADEQYSSYTFTGWNPAVAAVEADATYTATFHGMPVTTALEEAISAAKEIQAQENAEYVVKPAGTEASAVANGVKFALQADKDTFDAAVTVAEGALTTATAANTASTAADVALAATTLNAASVAFKATWTVGTADAGVTIADNDGDAEGVSATMDSTAITVGDDEELKLEVVPEAKDDAAVTAALANATLATAKGTQDVLAAYKVDLSKVTTATGDAVSQNAAVGNMKLEFPVDGVADGTRVKVLQLHEAVAGDNNDAEAAFVYNATVTNGKAGIILQGKLSQFIITAATWTVTFDPDNGAVTWNETVADGSTVAKPANPTKNGCTFKEWQKDGATWDFTTPVTEAITLKATYTQNATPAPVTKVTMWRLYNPYSGEHFYTSSDSERAGLIAAGWSDEGKGWTAPKTSGTPVYRLYNPYHPLGDHHYTTSKAEYDQLVAAGWSGEGTGWYSDDAKGVPLYRQYNPYAYDLGQSGSHNYTTSKSENDNLVSVGWNAEGTAWYGCK